MRKSLVTIGFLSCAASAPGFAQDVPTTTIDVPAETAAAATVPTTQPAATSTSPYSFTANVMLASEYIYRGIAQSNRKPAIQGGFDFSHESGIYLGTWASSISWLSDQPTSGGAAPISSNIEWDFYGGYKFTLDPIGLDFGILQYYYPGSYPDGFTSPNTTELYGAASWQWLTLKYSYALTNLFGAKSPQGEDTDGSWYLELNGNFDLGDGFGLQAHYGRQEVQNFSAASYDDWKIGFTKDVKWFVIGLAYIGTDAKGDPGEFYRNADNRNLGASRALLSVSKTF